MNIRVSRTCVETMVEGSSLAKLVEEIVSTICTVLVGSAMEVVSFSGQYLLSLALRP